MTAPRRGWARPARSRRGLSPPEGAKRSACGERGHSPPRRGPTPKRVGAVAHESWGPLPTRVGGRCPRRERVGGRCPRELGAVAHEERVGGRCPRREGDRRETTRPTMGRGLAAKGIDDPRVKKGPVRAGDYRPREGGPLRGRGPSGGERTCVVTERPRIPAQAFRRSESSLSGRSPGTKSAQLRSKNGAYADAPEPSRRSESPGRYRTNSTEGTLRS